MDHVDGFLMLVIIVIMSVGFIFGMMWSSMLRNGYNNQKKKKPTVEFGLFQIKDMDHAAIHF